MSNCLARPSLKKPGNNAVFGAFHTDFKGFFGRSLPKSLGKSRSDPLNNYKHDYAFQED